MIREEAKIAMSLLIDVFRKEYPNGGAFAAIQATGGHSLINKIYDAHETEIEELRSTIDRFVEEAAMYSNALDRNKETHKTELEAKDERIEAQSSVIIACQNAILQKDERIAELETERDKYNTIAANLQISRQKAYDNIAELEAMVQKMKCCENCESHTNVGSNCLLDMEDSLDCRANNYSNWKLKDNE